MPMQQLPTAAQYRPVNPILSDIAAVLLNEQRAYVGMNLLPTAPVGNVQKTGTIIRADVGAMFGDGSTSLSRSPGSDFPTGIGGGLSNITYVADQYAYAVDIADEEARDAQIDLWKFKLGEGANRLAIKRELNLLGVIGTSGNWTGSFSAGTAWTASGSDPMADFATGQTAVDLYGRLPNTVCLTYSAFDAFRRNAAVLSFMPTTMDRNLATESYVQQLIGDSLGIPANRVFIARASRNTANQGASATIARLATGWAWVGYVELGDGTSVAVNGGQAVQTQATALMRLPVQDVEVEEYRDAARRRQVANMTFEESIKPVNAQLGCLISGVA